MYEQQLMMKRFWISALITLLSASVSAAYSLAELLGPGSDDSLARYAQVIANLLPSLSLPSWTK
jgi:hypothetical protein